MHKDIIILLFYFGVISQSFSQGSGYTLNFSANKKVVTASSPIQGNSDYTVECFFKYSGYNNTGSYLRIFGTDNFEIEAGVKSDNILYFFDNNNWKSTGINIADNNWHFFAVTRNGNLFKLYLDGTLILDYSSAINPINPTYWVIGATFINDSFWSGNIDEFRVWNTALSQNEIQTWMCKKITSSHPNYENLAAYYNFDEGTGTTLTDGSGNGHDGTLINAPAWEISGAPIGDESVFAYGEGDATSLTINHTDGSSFTLDNFTGVPSGVQLYLVNEAPNNLTENASGDLESSRYFGTFITGGSNPRFTITYNYTGNTALDGAANEPEARLSYRASNAANSWSLLGSNFNLSRSNKKIKIADQSNGEFCAVFDDAKVSIGTGSGSMLQLNGNNQYVSIPSAANLNPTNEITIEAWYKATQTWTGQGIEPIVLKSYTSHTAPYYQYGLYAVGPNYTNPSAHGQFRFIVTNASNTTYALATALDFISVGQWYHIAGTYNGSTMNLYIDGELVASTSVSGNLASFNTGVELGKLRNYNTYLPGQIDEVRIWKSALSQSTIQNWMSKKIIIEHPYLSDLIAYYNFDDGTGTTITDISGNGNDGTLVNAPTWQTSSAPIGDDLAFATSVSSGSSLNLTKPGGDNITINVTSGTANSILIYLINEAPNQTNPPIGVNQLSQNNYYGVKAFGTSGLIYEVVYNYTNHGGIIDENNLVLCSRSNNSTSNWTLQSAILNTTAKTLTLGGQTGTEFILGSSGSDPLPIELIHFSASLINKNQVFVKWITATENNNQYFTIERSWDAISFHPIKVINGAGSSAKALNYQYTDELWQTGTFYYRLKQTDYDDKYSYSAVESISNTQWNNEEWHVYPNPAHDFVFIENAHAEKVRIYDIAGKEKLKAIGSKIDISLLKKGLYFIKGETSGTIKAFVKE